MQTLTLGSTDAAAAGADTSAGVERFEVYQMKGASDFDSGLLNENTTVRSNFYTAACVFNPSFEDESTNPNRVPCPAAP